MMDCSVSCAIKNFEDQFLEEVVDDDDEYFSKESLTVPQRNSCLGDVVDAAKELRNKI